LKADPIHFFKAVLIVYISAMVLSWFIQVYYPGTEKPNLYEHEKTISLDGLRVPVTYYHLSRPGNEETFVILPDVLLGPDFLLPLAESIQPHADVIILKYPQNDLSEEQPGYSAETRSLLAYSLISELSPENPHLLGHGYGGLVALNLLAELDADSGKFQSLSLLASYGPVEMHFMGNYTFNRAIYSLLYPVVTAAKYLTPHMGWYDYQPLQYPVIHAITSMDLRTVRPHAALLDIPVLIMHPKKDRYISLQVSKETHRLIPHSFLVTPGGSHRDIRANPGIWKKQLIWFANLASSGELPGRQEANEERIAQSEQPFHPDEMRSLGGWSLILFIALLALFTLFGEDFATISAGLIVASGLLNYGYAVLACFIGILISDVSIYLIGRWIGKPVLDWPFFRWLIKKEDVESAETMFRMKGLQIIFASRFIPGSRFPTYLVAGILKTRLTHFLGYFVLAAAIWTPFIVGLSSLIGTPLLNFIEVYQDYALLVFILIVLIIYLLFKLILPLTTPTGRRRFIVKWGRMKERYFEA
jgi:membrane protein DedA with SNARE-associated domain/surfactin synthase thioesterase subunit